MRRNQMKSAVAIGVLLVSTGLQAQFVDRLQTDRGDFAKIERAVPITPAERNALLPDIVPGEDEPEDPAQKMRGFTQVGLENLYARLTAGKIPDGAFKGAVILPRGHEHEMLFNIAHRMGLTLTRLQIEALIPEIWKGKTFQREISQLRNRMTALEIPLFPAKVHCGVGLLDRRKESILIDYAFSNDSPDYNGRVDWIAKDLKVLDEIRQISAGFYLGRANMNGIFVLNFILYRRAFQEVGEDCEVGTRAPN